MNVRELILDMLLQMEAEGAYSNLLIRDVLDKYDYLEAKDKAFVKRAAEGTVERRIQIDYVLDHFSKVPVKKMKPLIRCLMRMSVYQILFMDSIPDAAACNEAVKLAAKRKFGQLKGFVNGVLRNISRNKEGIGGIYPDREKEPLKYLSVFYSMPEFLVSMWLEDYGMERTEKMLRAMLEVHPVTIRVRQDVKAGRDGTGRGENGIKDGDETEVKAGDGKENEVKGENEKKDEAKAGDGKEEVKGEDGKENEICRMRESRAGRGQGDGRQGRMDTLLGRIREAGIKAEPHPYLDYAFCLTRLEGVRNIPGFAEGLFTVQDVSSMLAVECAGIREGDFVLDVCAAPGGKGTHAAERLNGTGKVLCRDISEEKAALIRENVRRLGLTNIEIQVYDGRVYDESLGGEADVVLADLPCSGLGILGKKRDIKYHITPEGLQELPRLQKELLDTVWRYVKPQGTLVYTTCTIRREENEEIARWFLENYPFVPEDISVFLEKVPGKKTAGDGRLQLLPGVHETDGFFIAKFRRKG